MRKVIPVVSSLSSVSELTSCNQRDRCQNRGFDIKFSSQRQFELDNRQNVKS